MTPARKLSRIVWPLPVGQNRIRGGSKRHTFGMVRANADGSPRAHQGWDFAAPVWTPCLAVADGQVVDVSTVGAYGLCVLLRLREPLSDGRVAYAFYAHLSAAEVAVGDVVTAGALIGRTGRSGNADLLPRNGSEDHLHFEIRTERSPPRGLAGRVSPMVLLGPPPLTAPV